MSDKKRCWSKILLFVTCCLCGVSCNLPLLEKKAPAINEIVAGEKFRINLPEDHTTGYGWQLSGDFDKSLIEEINAVWHGKEKGIDFNFKALSSGQTTITLMQRKYTDTAHITSYVVKIFPKD